LIFIPGDKSCQACYVAFPAKYPKLSVLNVHLLNLVFKTLVMSDLVFISPFFIVADLQDSVSFYVGKLGFRVQYMGPEEGPYFAMIGRGPVSLMLKSSGQPVPNHTRYDWARWDAFISVTDRMLYLRNTALPVLPSASPSTTIPTTCGVLSSPTLMAICCFLGGQMPKPSYRQHFFRRVGTFYYFLIS